MSRHDSLYAYKIEHALRRVPYYYTLLKFCSKAPRIVISAENVSNPVKRASLYRLPLLLGGKEGSGSHKMSLPVLPTPANSTAASSTRPLCPDKTRRSVTSWVLSESTRCCCSQRSPSVQPGHSGHKLVRTLRGSAEERKESSGQSEIGPCGPHSAL